MNTLCEDGLFYEISSYLEFDDKIRFGKVIGKNLIKPLTIDCIKSARDIIFKEYDDCDVATEDDEDHIYWIMSDLRYQFSQDFEDNFEEYEYGFPVIYRLEELFDATFTTIYSRKYIEYIANNNLDISVENLNYRYFEDTFLLDSYEMVSDSYKLAFENDCTHIFCDMW